MNTREDPTPYRMVKTPVGMGDGRTLTYYDFAPIGAQPQYLDIHQSAAKMHPPPGPRVLPKPSEMRWNPTLGEWTVYAAHRMARPMLPSPDACPLCPGILEIPLPYQIAIFENRAPALSNIAQKSEPEAEVSDTTFELTKTAYGHCDMVAYSQEHNSQFARMPLEEIACLVEAWRDRYIQLTANPATRYVAIMENKEREAGMTLDHPHGQTYAFTFLPPKLQKQYEQTLTVPDLWNRIIEKEQREKTRILCETDGFLAAMPFYARYPYEVHIWAKREGVSSLQEMTPQERRELAAVLKNITLRYENLWPNARYGFPTLMLMQQLTNLASAAKFRFHIEFYPLQRSPDKLKYRASIESGTGTFLNDALPETQAAELKNTAPQQIELPDIIFQPES